MMERLRDAAMSDPYALNELRHLTDNIGPRLSGSPQAQQAVDYVAAEMRALGAEVTLEKATVPHWVRGVETAEVVSWPGQAPGTTQKIVLTALGGSVATPAEGLTAEVVVVDDWHAASRAAAGRGQGQNPALQSQIRQGTGRPGRRPEGLRRRRGLSRRRARCRRQPWARWPCWCAPSAERTSACPTPAMTEYAPDVPKIPAAAVTAEDADLLKNLAGQGPVKLHLTLTPQTLPDAAQLQRHRRLEGNRAPRAGGHRLRPPRLLGPRHRRHRRRRGRGRLHAGHSPAARSRHSSPPHRALRSPG